MAVDNHFIPNSEAVAYTESRIFEKSPESKFALVCLGRGLERPGEGSGNSISHAYLRLRKKVYVDMTGMIPPDSPNVIDGRYEYDEDDIRSTHLVVLENMGRGSNTVGAVACMRMIEKTRQNNRPLPIENIFDDTFSGNPAPENSSEVSRLLTCIDNNSDRVQAIGQMFNTAVAHYQYNNIQPIYGIVEPRLERTLSFLGAPPQRLAKPKMVEEYNDVNVGIEIDVPAMRRAMGEQVLRQSLVLPGSVRYWQEIEDFKDDRPPKLKLKTA